MYICPYLLHDRSPLLLRVQQLIKLHRMFISFSFTTDLRPFELNFDTLPTSPSIIDCSNYELNYEVNFVDESSNKRKQPKRTVKTRRTKTVPEKESDSLPRKILIYNDNKFYCDRKADRKLIWKCSTSRFTNCTAQLTTKYAAATATTLNDSHIIAITGTHDHANNTE